MSLACLERLTAAHPENCLSLVTSSVEFSRGKRSGFPAVPLACVLLVRNKQLIANRATQICVETCLQLLMNLTHSDTGSAIVNAHKGVESLAEIVWQLSTSCSKDAPAETTSSKVSGNGAGGDSLLLPVCICIVFHSILCMGLNHYSSLRDGITLLSACRSAARNARLACGSF